MSVSGRDRQVIYLYLPCLPVRRLIRLNGWSEQDKTALYQRIKGADRLVYLSATAQQAGLQADMSVADARARFSDIRLAPVDHDGDRALFTALARWAFRFSPVVGVDAPGLGLWIDATGASHLFGGLQAMCADLHHQLSQAGLVVHLATAPTFAAAWALAHYHMAASAGPVHAPDRRHQMRAFLSDLPVAALRLDPALQLALSRAGLRQIGHLYPLGWADLTARFGPGMVRRYAQLFGDQPERPVPVAPLQPVLVTQAWSEPVIGYDALCRMVSQLTDQIADRLLQAEQGARSFELGWQRTDGQVGRLYFRLSRPGRRKHTLHRLLSGAAEKIDAEFGVEYCWIQAHGLTADIPLTAVLGTDEDSLKAGQVSDLVDVLAARLGPDKVQRVINKPDWQITDSQAYLPVADVTDKTGHWPMPVLAGLSAPRPVRLFDHPEPVKVVAMLPDHPPAMIRWRHHNWTVLRATGPERVGPRWWDHSSMSSLSRDYYRVEVETGQRLWLCREGLVDRGDQVSWFVHGVFS